MELTNDFEVGLPVAEAWAVLTDLERIAPCMPGAQLQEVEGEEYRGVVKVKVGPIAAQYKGVATFVSQDAGAHVAVLRAEGRETRGQGNANATITATLTPSGAGTAVSLATDLQITGKVAQFGRGVLADVSAKLLTQFVECLEQTVLAETPLAAPAGPEVAQPEAAEPEVNEVAEPAKPVAAEREAAATANAAPRAPVTEPAPSPGVRTIESPEAKPVDLLGTAGTPVAKRVGPVLAAIALVWVLKKLLTRKR
jgi:uncharacterized protein